MRSRKESKSIPIKKKLTARLLPDSVAAATNDAGLFIAVVLAKKEEIVRWPEEARGADIFSSCSIENARRERERERERRV